MKILIYILSVYFLLISSLKCDNKRNWEVTNSCSKSGNNIVHYKGVSKSRRDAVHIVYGAGVDFKLFSGWIIVSSENSSIGINCNSTDDFITLNDTIRASYALVITKLFDFDDSKDKAEVKYSNQTTVYNFSDFVWKLNKMDDSVSFIADSRTNDLFSNNGTIEIKIKTSNIEKYSTSLPGLRYSSDNNIFDVSLDRLKPKTKMSRFALEFAFINLQNNAKFQFYKNKTMDDQKSPGVFQTNTWLSKHHNETSGYMQWKPVCYTNGALRNLNFLSLATNDTAKSLINTDIEDSLVFKAYNGTFSGKLMNISFGMTGDKWYARTNYTVWSVSFGSGTPLVAQMSSTLVLVIILGLGLPFLLIIVGSVYLFVKRHLGRSNDIGNTGNYDSIN